MYHYPNAANPTEPVLGLGEKIWQFTGRDKLADQARAAAVATGQPSRDPIVDRYEVVISR